MYIFHSFYRAAKTDIASTSSTGGLFPDHLYSIDRITLQGCEGVPCTFLVPDPDRICTVLAAAACGIQVVFWPVLPAAVAASQYAVFAEHKLSGQMQILFPAFLLTGVQYITPFIYWG